MNVVYKIRLHRRLLHVSQHIPDFGAADQTAIFESAEMLFAVFIYHHAFHQFIVPKLSNAKREIKFVMVRVIMPVDSDSAAVQFQMGKFAQT